MPYSNRSHPHLRLDEQRAELLDLDEDGAAARATGGVAALDTRLKVEHVRDVGGERRADGLELLERELREGHVGLLREADAGARDVVRLAEGDLGRWRMCLMRVEGRGHERVSRAFVERTEGARTPLRTRYSAKSVASMSGDRKSVV